MGAKKHNIMSELATSGLSTTFANIATLPLDTLKVRLQLQTSALVGAGGVATPSQGLIMTGVNVVRYEGVGALYSGISAAVGRGLLYGGVRLGTYAPIKTMLAGESTAPSLARNITAGCISGALAAVVANPVDLIKTRMQAKGNPHRTSLAVIRNVLQTQGLQGFWVGTMPAVVRASVLTATQCATYDEAKKAFKAMTGANDGLVVQLGAGLMSGLVTTTITAPVDVIKTNLFASNSQYTGAFQCAADIIKREGPLGLMKGWSASYVRLGPQTVILFLTMEAARKWAGLAAL